MRSKDELRIPSFSPALKDAERWHWQLHTHATCAAKTKLLKILAERVHPVLR